MQAVRGIDDLVGGALLDEVARLHAQREDADRRIFCAAIEWAYQCGEGRWDGSLSNDGCERLIRLGGEGTPLVAEFAPAAFAARLQLSPYAGRQLIADALDLRHRLPRLHARLLAGEVRISYARFVARKTRELGVEQAGRVDAAVAESADGRVPWSRFETLVEAAIIKADPEAARAREEAAAQEQFAKPTRSTEHGMRGFYLRAHFALIARLDAVVAFLADALARAGHSGTVDERRVLAVALLSDPERAVAFLRWAKAGFPGRDEAQAAGCPSDVPADLTDDQGEVTTDSVLRDLLPAIVLYVHLGGSGVARVEGLGPVTEGWVRATLGERCRFTIRPVFDPLGQTPVDAYEIPARHRQAVRLMTPADVFPYAANTSVSMQIDHTEAYVHRGPDGKRPKGQSRIGNYGPMATFHHRIKTFGHWICKQPFPGIYLWRDPYDTYYLVDHTGTRRVSSRLDQAS
jgi:hypothetical protein